MKYFYFLIVLSFSALAKDSVPIGPDGKVTVLFEKDGYLMARHCPKYTIVKSRKDCKADKDLLIMPIERLHSVLTQNAKDHLASRTTKDPNFRGIINFSPLDKITKSSYEDKVLSMKAYQERYGSKVVDTEELAKMDLALTLNAKVDKEIDLAIERIQNEKFINLESPEAVGLSYELTKILVTAIQAQHLYTYGARGRCEIKERPDYKGYRVVDSKNDVVAECPDKCHQMMIDFIQSGQCSGELRFKEVPIDPTADEAISQTQRSIILKDTPASIQGGQGTKAKGTGKQ